MQPITVEVTIQLPAATCWTIWTNPTDICQWNHPWDDWHNPSAVSDLREGGHFLFRMEKKDGSAGFDFDGIYNKLVENELMEYTGSDGRKSSIQFVAKGSETTLIETFEPGPEPSLEIQRSFCQGVIDNFKKYAEASHRS